MFSFQMCREECMLHSTSSWVSYSSFWYLAVEGTRKVGVDIIVILVIMIHPGEILTNKYN